MFTAISGYHQSTQVAHQSNTVVLEYNQQQLAQQHTRNIASATSGYYQSTQLPQQPNTVVLEYIQQQLAQQQTLNAASATSGYHGQSQTTRQPNVTDTPNTAVLHVNQQQLAHQQNQNTIILEYHGQTLAHQNNQNTAISEYHGQSQTMQQSNVADIQKYIPRHSIKKDIHNSQLALQHNQQSTVGMYISVGTQLDIIKMKNKKYAFTNCILIYSLLFTVTSVFQNQHSVAYTHDRAKMNLYHRMIQKLYSKLI